MNTATSNNVINNSGNSVTINGGGSGTSVSVTTGNQSIVSNTSATSTSNGGSSVNTATSNNVITHTGNSVVINNTNNSNTVNTSTSNNSINNSGNSVVINNNNSNNVNTSTSNNVINNSGNTVTINNSGNSGLVAVPPRFFPTDGETDFDGSVRWIDHQCTENGIPVNFSVCCEAGVVSEESGDTTSPCPVYSYDTVLNLCSIVSPLNPFMPASLVYG